MRAITLAVVGLLVTGVALAQDREPPMVFVPTFTAEPTHADLVRNFPSAALAQNASGIAVLCCEPRQDRSVACRLNQERPSGHGFGDASVRASSAYRLSEESYGDLAARPGTQVRISMIWAAPVISQSTIDDLRRIDGETMQACLAQEAED